MTVYRAALYVITTLGARQPITDQCVPGAGAMRAHAQLCTAEYLQICNAEMFQLFIKFLCDMVIVGDRVRVSVRIRAALRMLQNTLFPDKARAVGFAPSPPPPLSFPSALPFHMHQVDHPNETHMCRVKQELVTGTVILNKNLNRIHNSNPAPRESAQARYSQQGLSTCTSEGEARRRR